MTRQVSRTAALRRLGFAEASVAEARLQEPALAGLVAPAPGVPLEDSLGRAADPDLALLTLLRLAEAAEVAGEGPLLARALSEDGARARLLAVLGMSTALGNALVARPAQVALFTEENGHDDEGAAGQTAGSAVLRRPAHRVRAELLAAVGADAESPAPVATVAGRDGVNALRRAYRSRLMQIAAEDLTCADPLATFPAVAAAIADAVAATLDAALAVARADLPEAASAARLAVIGMGKTGGRELNYISDVDVVYVVEPVDGGSEEETVRAGTALASALAQNVSAVGDEPSLWPLDANLRPEGKDGPLVRTLASHVAYCERWAKGWEFQAMLKARPVAGDRELGTAYCDAVGPMVWGAVEKNRFVEDSQAMRRRVEQHIPSADADRQLKLGPGGLRDVEFTVQLLQLVHGRTDSSIRSRTTLEGLAQLAAGEYVARDDAELLDHHYRFLRVLEHRIQLHRLRRSHLVPTDEADLRRLGRAIGVEGVDGAESLTKRLRQIRRDVRHLHEEIFYRPLLPLTARLSTSDVSLAPEAARARLAAIGYDDPSGALHHIAALTEGISRAASIQRQLLPVMLGWLAEGPVPDAGLLAFRKLSELIGGTPWYLRLLRDSGEMPRRLAALLSTSRYVADALGRMPEAVAWLDEEDDLAPRSADALREELAALQGRRTDPGEKVLAGRFLRRRELVRAAIGQVLGMTGRADSARIITRAADVALDGALRVAIADATAEAGLDVPPSRYLIVAMGRLGGQEMGYASDADVLFVHEPEAGADEETATRVALEVAARTRSFLAGSAPEPPLTVDADLRPEGRHGPMSRSLASYAEYYERWVEPWERQALLRARPVAGDPDLAARFAEMIAAVRYPADGLPADQVRELRRIKARVEDERMPRGVAPTRHVKLGPGGLSDVEWIVQLLQLRHAGRVAELRTTSTLEALEALREADVVSAEDEAVLSEAWLLASGIRDAIVLGSGRASGRRADVLPHEVSDLEVVARLLGHEPGERLDLEERWLRAARRARTVTERLFYE